MADGEIVPKEAVNGTGVAYAGQMPTHSIEERKEAEPKRVVLGRTSYSPRYCQDLIDWVSGPRHFSLVTKEFETKQGVAKEYKMVANPFPSLEGFAHVIGCNRRTLTRWASEFPEFAEAIQRAKEMQKHWLMDVATKGLCPPAWAIFMAKNISEMRDDPPAPAINPGSRVIEFEPFTKRITDAVTPDAGRSN